MNIRQKMKNKFIAVVIFAVLVGLFSYPQILAKIPKLHDFFNKYKINLGLDLQGGIHLEYKTDLSQVADNQKSEALEAVQDVIERRVNAFGVAEPVIYTTKSGAENRLIVELAGVKDIDEAKKLIKDTPFLEFKEEKLKEVKPENEISQEMLDSINASNKKQAEEILAEAKKGGDFSALAKEKSSDPDAKENGGDIGFAKKEMFAIAEFKKALFESELRVGEVYSEIIDTPAGWYIVKKLEERGDGDEKEVRSAQILISKVEKPKPEMEFVSTGLSGKNLESATVEFRNQGLSEPQVSLKFDSEGARLFAEITKRNIGKRVAIYLDEEPISIPTVQTEIADGQAVITGNFSIEEAKALVKRLNEGALPVPISLISQQSIEASLGAEFLAKSLKAGMIGFILVVIFMLTYYRFLGLIASVSLLIYTGFMIVIFKFSGYTPWQITLTLPGIAGFILSIGMAVDANILIFERTKEEIKNGRNVTGAIEEGFKRAWTSIRDGNISSIITSIILIGLGMGFVKGFAVTLIIGVVVSMFTAITITRTILSFLIGPWMENRLWLIGARRKTEETKTE